MRIEGRRESTNVEDRRRMKPAAAAGGLGIVGLVIFLIVSLLSGDPRKAAQVVQDMNAGQGGAVEQIESDEPLNPAEEAQAKFVRVVLADTEDVFRQLFADAGREYRDPTLVLFKESVQSACGIAGAATGPFYCPLDQKLYLDLSFFQEMEERFQAPGDFARAYVVAHEVGHHVQNLLGIMEQVQAQRARLSQEEYNQLSVRLELQADYLAGVWANHAQQNWDMLEEGDVKEAINAAQAIGDDRLQMEAQGYTVPESFNHGTSDQRARWFYKGLQSGKIEPGNTFEAEEL
jgi:predicted metalloprotease